MNWLRHFVREHLYLLLACSALGGEFMRFGFSAYAADFGCESRGRPEKRIADLPLLQEVELPLDIVQKIQMSGLATKFSAELGEGENLHFCLPLLPEEEKMSRFYIGESLQAIFVAKTLQVLFPKASVSHLRASWNSPKAEVAIYMADASEIFSMKPKGRFINMPTLKMANGMLSQLSHFSLRESLGIRNEAFVVSLYVAEGYMDLANAALEGIIRERGRDPDILFVSHGTRSDHSAHPSVTPLLSALPREGLHTFEPEKYSSRSVVVFNNLKGKMSYLHAISDLAVISGPVNIFESINVATPTLFFNVPFRKYNKATFDRMAKAAIRSGGGVEVRESGEIATGIKRVLQISRSDIVPAYRIENVVGSFFDDYLNELAMVLSGEFREKGLTRQKLPFWQRFKFSNPVEH